MKACEMKHPRQKDLSPMEQDIRIPVIFRKFLGIFQEYLVNFPEIFGFTHDYKLKLA